MQHIAWKVADYSCSSRQRRHGRCCVGVLRVNDYGLLLSAHHAGPAALSGGPVPACSKPAAGIGQEQVSRHSTLLRRRPIVRRGLVGSQGR